ncbi:AAA family ATPase [Streptomyces sp. NRRL S-1868]|uniref:AAA family ATPase n=1 Tax=Streptomyces sp. NRRL S-1868 TaxID=1463892 RepID=UPI001F3EC08B|nr:ATP-binding protein [Streptomyces sp. NRRL S-1868]
MSHTSAGTDTVTAPSAPLSQLRLTRFKTFRDAVLPLAPLTVLIGRNSSGKSNALDGLDVLSRLAEGEEIRDALDGRRRDTGSVRGGLEGCPPHGEDVFTLGCTVDTPWEAPAHLDVTVQVHPDVRIVSERLTGPTYGGHKVLFETLPPQPDSGDIGIKWYNGKPGRRPHASLRCDRLLTTQLPTRLPALSDPEREVVEVAEVVTGALRGVFHLDPVPHLMRQYVPARDAELRRSAENLSAAVSRVAERDPAEFDRLVAGLRRIAEHPIEQVRTTRSDLGDVMLLVDEGGGSVTPARELSDGMLRFLAVSTALLTGRHGVAIGTEPGTEPSLTLVVEELENGLHPSQASLLLELLHEASARERTQTLVTTHSPALLSALTGADHRGVVVCDRDTATGRSRLQQLTDLEGYSAAMAEGRLGDVITRGLLPGRPPERDYTEFDRLLGID